VAGSSNASPRRGSPVSDVDGILALLTDDVQFAMPPLPLPYHGPELAGRFLRATAFRPGLRGDPDPHQG